jgi:N-acetylglucosamine-6-phosphate deacetylase
MILLKNADILTPFTEINDSFLVIKDKKIHFLGLTETDKKELDHFTNTCNKVINLKGKIITPGFIDIHTHGALGKDYSDSPDLLQEDSVFRATNGVTVFLPTIGALVPPQDILVSAEAIVKNIKKGVKGTKPLGINLEGPCLHPECAGAAGPDNCSYQIDLDYLKEAKNIMGDMFKIITIAPELENGIEAIAYLRENDVVVSIGHTNADDATLDKAIRNGATLVTHIYNTGPIPEQNVSGVLIPGVNEYLVMRDEVMAEVNCDYAAVSVKPVVLRMLLRCKGIDKTIIITDSFYSAGLDPDQTYFLPDGREIYVKEGVNIQVENDQLSGSAMTMDQSIKGMTRNGGVSLKEAIQMATYNPARIINIDDRKGSILVGKDADLAVIDQDLNVYATFLEGSIIYDNLKSIA